MHPPAFPSIEGLQGGEGRPNSVPIDRGMAVDEQPESSSPEDETGKLLNRSRGYSDTLVTKCEEGTGPISATNIEGKVDSLYYYYPS